MLTNENVDLEKEYLFFELSRCFDELHVVYEKLAEQDRAMIQNLIVNFLNNTIIYS